MKKKLLLILLAVVGMSSAYADNYQEGDYIYTRNGKYKVIGENMIENGDFSNGGDGWVTPMGTPLNVGTEATDTFLLRSAGGPNDGPYIYQQLGTYTAANSSAVSKTNVLNQGDAIQKVVRFMDPGTYVVTYKVRNETSSALWTSATINGGRWFNYENIFTNADADPTTITKCIVDWWTYQPGEWTEVAYNVTIAADGTDDYLNIVIGGHAGGSISYADFGVYEVQEVGDTRIVQDAIDMVKYFVENPDFPNDQDILEDVISGLEEILNEEYDASTVRSTLYSLVYEEGCDFQSFLDANSVNVANYFTNFDFNAGTTARGTLPNGWSAPSGYGRIQAVDPAGALTTIHMREEIQSNYNLEASVVTQTVDLPGGKYIYIVQGSANRYGQDGRGSSSNYWWYRQGLKYPGVKCVVNGEEYEMDLPINATEAKTFVYSFETEDGDKTVGFSLPASTDNYGGTVRLDNIQFRLIGANRCLLQ